jgi:hypothetical protein
MSAEQLEWRDQVLAYAAKINAFAARGLSAGWDKAGPQPLEPKLQHLMRTAVEAIRDANRRGTWSTLREEWPPAHGPLIPWLEEHGQSIPVVHFLDDGVNPRASSIPIDAVTPCFDERGLQNPWSMFSAGSH